MRVCQGSLVGAVGLVWGAPPLCPEQPSWAECAGRAGCALPRVPASCPALPARGALPTLL